MAKFLTLVLFGLFLTACGGVGDEIVVPTPPVTPSPQPTPTLAIPMGGVEVASEERFNISFGQETYHYVYWSTVNTPAGVYGGNLRTLSCPEGFYAVIAIGYSGDLCTCDEAIVYVFPFEGNFRVIPTTRFSPGVVQVWKP